MIVKVLKGTNKIGGCVTEVKTEKSRIIIDLGEDLEGVHENPMIEGLTCGEKAYDAVFITHSHIDHIGLIDFILDGILVYVEEKSYELYKITCTFTYKPYRKDVVLFKFNEQISVNDKDILLTPFLVDHSSYNSSMFLIEHDKQKILHSGDFRNHGRIGNLLSDTLNKIGGVDALIVEGTSFSRDDTDYLTEENLSTEAKEIFKKYNQVFILASSTNIDRIVSFYEVRGEKNFIMDIFTANVVSLLSEQMPKPGFKDVYVWESSKYYKKSSKFYYKYIHPFTKYMNSSAPFSNFCMYVKSSMLEDIKKLKEKGAITNACILYSMWPGYKEKEDINEFLTNVENLGIKPEKLHTSGHASLNAYKLFEEYLKPKKVIPIHTVNKEKAKEIFKNATIIEDNEEVEI